MRIAHYMIGLCERGGIAVYTRELGDALCAAGHEVLYFDLERSRNPAGDWPEIQYVADEAALLAELERQKVDLLHTHILLEQAAKSKVPVLRTLHGHEPYCPSGGHYLARQREACTRRYHPIGCTWGHVVDRCGSMRPLNLLADLRRARAEMKCTMPLHVATVSEYLRQQMIRNGYEAARIHTLHPPAPPLASWTALADGQPRFVFIGRVTPSKGVDWLLRAAAEAKTDFAVDIAGDGNAMASVKELASTSGRSVRFHGWLDHERTRGLISNCRALVVPSLWPEPAGLVALEAMANGRAVIAAGHGGLPELVGRHGAGILVSPNDVGELATALDRLAIDPGAANAMGQAGQRRIATHFTAEAHLQKLLELYQQVIGEWRR